MSRLSEAGWDRIKMTNLGESITPEQMRLATLGVLYEVLADLEQFDVEEMKTLWLIETRQLLIELGYRQHKEGDVV